MFCTLVNWYHRYFAFTRLRVTRYQVHQQQGKDPRPSLPSLVRTFSYHRKSGDSNRLLLCRRAITLPVFFPFLRTWAKQSRCFCVSRLGFPRAALSINSWVRFECGLLSSMVCTGNCCCAFRLKTNATAAVAKSAARCVPLHGMHRQAVHCCCLGFDYSSPRHFGEHIHV